MHTSGLVFPDFLSGAANRLVVSARTCETERARPFSFNLVQDATDTEESADRELLASAMAMSDGAPIEEREAAATRAAKHLSLRRETVLQWLHQTAGAGGSIAICYFVL